MSSLATASRPAESRPDRTAVETRSRLGITSDAVLGLVLAGALALLAFLTTGGTDLAPNTWVQIAVTAIAAGLAGAVLVTGARGRIWGGATLLLFAALAALTYASIAWSAQPATSWLEANRTLSYLAAFAAAVTAARLAPGRWRLLVGAIGTAATVLAGYALLVKVFPGSLDANDAVARLRAPFGYWNATGLIAAMGLPPCVWAGARREGSRALRALAVPSIAVLVVVLVLSYSRGALAAAVLGLGLWFALAPTRLRGALVLALGAAGAAVPTAWALGTPGIARDGMPLHARTLAGHHFGVILLIAIVVLVPLGFVAARAMERVVLSPRATRRVGRALIGLLALVPVGAVIALAGSSRGLTGEISHQWNSLTNPNSVVFENAGRLGQLGSSRPRYWSQGLTVGDHALFKGVGARAFGIARTRYSSDQLPVADAHSYLIETFADFGLIGLVLSLALLVAWMVAARRALVAPAARAREHLEERTGLAALLATVVIFGVSSLIDWTWFIPGVTVPALLCAGWLAGRGPLAEPVGRLARARSPLNVPALGAGLVALVAVAFAGAWFVWQPLRSADADAAAVKAMLSGNGDAALANARTAVASNPVSVDALSDLSAVYSAMGNLRGARAALLKATSVQPQNLTTWIALAKFDLYFGPAKYGLRELERGALPLDPSSSEIHQLIDQARAEVAAGD